MASSNQSAWRFRRLIFPTASSSTGFPLCDKGRKNESFDLMTLDEQDRFVFPQADYPRCDREVEDRLIHDLKACCWAQGCELATQERTGQTRGRTSTLRLRFRCANYTKKRGRCKFQFTVLWSIPQKQWFFVMDHSKLIHSSTCFPFTEDVVRVMSSPSTGSTEKRSRKGDTASSLQQRSKENQKSESIGENSGATLSKRLFSDDLSACIDLLPKVVDDTVSLISNFSFGSGNQGQSGLATCGEEEAVGEGKRQRSECLSSRKRSRTEETPQTNEEPAKPLVTAKDEISMDSTFWATLDTSTSTSPIPLEIDFPYSAPSA